MLPVIVPLARYLEGREMQVEGVPDGWELVAIRAPKRGDWIVNVHGAPVLIESDWCTSNIPIIRKVAPVCTWPHGVFADGWIAEDKGGEICWYSVNPEPGEDWDEWMYDDGSIECLMARDCQNLLNAPVFRADLPWDQRIQQVGPTIEAKLKGGA